MSPVSGDYEVRGWDGPGPGQSGRLVPPLHPQQRGQAGAGARGHRQPRPARRHQGVHHVQIVYSTVQYSTVQYSPQSWPPQYKLLQYSAAQTYLNLGA